MSIKKNKEFILGVVAYGNKPDKSNSIMLSIVNDYTKLTGEVVDLNTCLTCGKNNVFDKIYQYAVDNSIWEVKPKQTKKRK